MRGKKAKRLRKIAKMVSVDMPDKSYEWVRKLKRIKGKWVEKWVCINKPDSTRGIYRALKRDVKRARI